MKKEYEQSAFPYNWDSRHNPSFDTVEGMTLLDYFAAKAAMAICQDRDVFRVNDWGLDASRIAQSAYDIAAAMMEERKKYLEDKK